MKYVIVAEDDKFLANAYRVKLEKGGLEVMVAGDGREALRLMKERIPDLVIMDLIMPLLDGFEALEAMKKDNNLAKIPVIIASNLSQKEDIDRGMKLGAVDYIVKSEMPIGQILEKIKGILKIK